MSFQFPREIKDLIDKIGDETHWKILECLINNENKLSYTQLKQKLRITDDKKGTFNYHLKELQKAGWLRNWLEDTSEMTDNQKSFYAISKFGLTAINGVMKAMDEESYQYDTLKELANTFARSTQPISEIIQHHFLIQNSYLATANIIDNPEEQLLYKNTALITKRKMTMNRS